MRRYAGQLHTYRDPVGRCGSNKVGYMSLFDLLLTFYLFAVLVIIQPILLAVFVGHNYGRNKVLWGLITSATNVSIVVFFERSLPARSLLDLITEISLVMIISVTSSVVILELLRNGPQARTAKNLIGRGVFRIWVLISTAWIFFCALEFVISPLGSHPYNCCFLAEVLFGAGYTELDYFDIGKAFVGVPAFAFIVCVAVRWVTDGFRRSAVD